MSDTKTLELTHDHMHRTHIMLKSKRFVLVRFFGLKVFSNVRKNSDKNNQRNARLRMRVYIPLGQCLCVFVCIFNLKSNVNKTESVV